MRYSRLNYPDWVFRIKPGDVLRWPSGKLRIVREIHDRRGEHYHRGTVDGRKIWFFFTILNCSWTTRAYTLYSAGELLCMGVRPTRARFNVQTKFDRALRGDIDKNPASECDFHCCDVKGIS